MPRPSSEVGSAWLTFSPGGVAGTGPPGIIGPLEAPLAPPRFASVRRVASVSRVTLPQVAAQGPAAPRRSLENHRHHPRLRHQGLGGGDDRRRRRRDLVPQLLHQRRIGGALDDPGELGAVVGRQAHAVDHDVAHGPAITALDHPILERQIPAVAAEHGCPHGGLTASHGLAEVAHPRTAVNLSPRGDPGDERPLEEVAIQVRELLALGLAAIPPRGSERELRRLADVEDLAGDGANGSPDAPACLPSVSGSVRMSVASAKNARSSAVGVVAQAS